MHSNVLIILISIGLHCRTQPNVIQSNLCHKCPRGGTRWSKLFSEWQIVCHSIVNSIVSLVNFIDDSFVDLMQSISSHWISVTTIQICYYGKCLPSLSLSFSTAGIFHRRLFTGWLFFRNNRSIDCLINPQACTHSIRSFWSLVTARRSLSLQKWISDAYAGTGDPDTGVALILIPFN
jgi:hypothetical protein